MCADRVRKIHCNDCGHPTNHITLHTETRTGSYDDFTDEIGDSFDSATANENGMPFEDDWHWRVRLEMLCCCGSDAISVLCITSEAIPGEETVSHHVDYYPPRVFRKRPKWFARLPKDIASLMNEIYA